MPTMPASWARRTTRFTSSSMKAWPPPWTTPWASNDLVGLALKCGEVNLRAMELLDAGNTGTYGHPVPTTVPLGHKKGKAILVSGHDLKDLEHDSQADARARASTSTPTAKCCPPTVIRN